MVEVVDLVKRYRTVTAVAGISCHPARHLLRGLLGPTGADKTTALEVIEGVIPPTSGEILFKGRPKTASFRDDGATLFPWNE